MCRSSPAITASSPTIMIASSNAAGHAYPHVDVANATALIEGAGNAFASNAWAGFTCGSGPRAEHLVVICDTSVRIFYFVYEGQYLLLYVRSPPLKERRSSLFANCKIATIGVYKYRHQVRRFSESTKPSENLREGFHFVISLPGYPKLEVPATGWRATSHNLLILAFKQLSP